MNPFQLKKRFRVATARAQIICFYIQLSYRGSNKISVNLKSEEITPYLVVKQDVVGLLISSDIAAIFAVLKQAVTQTYINFQRLLKSCNIINFKYLVSGCAICYENQHINRMQTVRYENYIPNGKGESGSMDLSFFIFNIPFSGFRFDTRFPDTIGCVYPKSICNI